MEKDMKNGQSAAKLLNDLSQEERSETIETIIKSDNDNGVEYTLNSGNRGIVENNSYVYKHIRLDNNQIFYIGVGTGQNYKRAKDIHSRNIFWKRIVSKTDYKIEIIRDNLNQKEAYNLEEKLVSFYGCSYNNTGILCNLMNGGRGGKIGLKQSKETVEKRIAKLKGQKRTPKHKQNISKSRLGAKFSDNHLLNLSKSHIGIKRSLNSIEKQIKNQNKIVLQFKNDVFINEWSSVKEAAVQYKIHPSNISKVCNGKQKSVAGYNWIYLNDMI